MTQPKKSLSFKIALAFTLAEARLRDGLTQDQIASRAQEMGLKWTRDTVAGIENGNRVLSIDEFLLLPVLFSKVDRGKFITPPLTDLLPKYRVVLQNGWKVGPDFIADILQGQVPPLRTQSSEIELPGEAERKAARKFNVSPEMVVNASKALWGHTLTAERQARLQKQKVVMTPPEAAARAGHITRQLLKELEPELKKGRKR